MAFGRWKADQGGASNQRDDLFGTSGGDSSAVAQIQVPKKTGKQHLRDALRDLRDAEDEGQETIVQLDGQREIINKISGNIKKINENVDVADQKIAEMSAPLGITLGGRRKKKHAVISLNPSSYVASGGRFVMTGWVQKQSKWIRSWNNRFFVLYGDEIFYFNKETEQKERGRIALSGARLQRLEVDEGFGFEIIGPRETTRVRVKKKEDYTSWQNHMQRAIDGRNDDRVSDGNGSRGGGAPTGGDGGGSSAFGGSAMYSGASAAPVDEEDQLLDQIMDSLGNLDGMARTIKTEVKEQNTALDSLQSDMLDVDGRLKKANRSMRRL